MTLVTIAQDALHVSLPPGARGVDGKLVGRRAHV
jgi:hypothetical protein